jgi:type II secretion system protein H
MQRATAFTLVELILVMALLCVILGLAAPSLSRSIHQRDLTQEATRVLAATEYARDEAVSLGVPMEVWIDAGAGKYGVKAMPGNEDAGARSKDFTLTEGVHFDAQKGSADAAGQTDVAEFTPDGTLDPSSATSLRLVDRTESAIDIAQTTDAWGYEIVKGTQ